MAASAAVDAPMWDTSMTGISATSASSQTCGILGSATVGP